MAPPFEIPPTGLALDEEDLAWRTGRIAAGLVELGLHPGDRIAVQAGNTPDWVAARLAVTALGLTFVPIHPKLTPAEVAYLVERSAARKLLVDEEAQLGMGLDFYPVAPQAIGATILFTSGTTGVPKGCLRTEAQEASRAMELIATYGLRSSDVHLVACPLAHSAPGIFLRACRAVGAKTVLMPRFDAAAFVEAVRLHAATVFFLVPTQVERLLALPAEVRARVDWSSVRAFIVAGAPFSRAAKERLIEWIGPGRLWEFYGSSETGTVAVCPPSEQPAPDGCVGRPPPGVELRICDERGGDVPPGDVGEVWVSSPAVMEGYIGGEAQFRRGFLSVGDLGYLDSAMRLVLVDRKHDVVISGGVNVYPAEVERALAEHPAIAGAVVCGLPDREWGERVAAVVALRPGAQLDELKLRDFLRERLAPFKLPRRYAFVAPEALPIGPTGKPLRRVARRLFD